MLLALVLVMLAFIPGLYLLQALLRHDRAGQLVADMVVRLNDRTPNHLVVALNPVEEESMLLDGTPLSGVAMLKGASFPWEDTPFEAHLGLELSARHLVEGELPKLLETGRGQMMAYYRERYTGTGGEITPRVPCSGQIEITRLRYQGGPPLEEWSQVRELKGNIELRCVGFGQDLARQTADDVHWTLTGQLEYRWRDPG